jgi:hypothetical protein
MWGVEQLNPRCKGVWPAGDEYNIRKRYTNLIWKTLASIPTVTSLRGCNDKYTAGRFMPIPQTKEELNIALIDIISRLRGLGFEVIVKEW